MLSQRDEKDRGNFGPQIIHFNITWVVRSGARFPSSPAPHMICGRFVNLCNSV